MGTFEDALKRCKNRASNSNTVNSDKKIYITVNSKTVDKEIQTENILEDDAMAKELSEKLDDTRSLGYYKLLITNNNREKLFDALAITLDASRMGMIRSKKAIYFIGVLRKLNMKTNFKN